MHTIGRDMAREELHGCTHNRFIGLACNLHVSKTTRYSPDMAGPTRDTPVCGTLLSESRGIQPFHELGPPGTGSGWLRDR